MSTMIETQPLPGEQPGRSLGNSILQSIPESELAILRPHLQEVSLKHSECLFEPNQPIEYVYFPHAGMVSLVVVTTAGQSVEVGVIGFEGFVGLPVVFGLTSSPHRALIQIAPAEAMRIKTETLQRLIDSTPELKAKIDRFAIVQGLIVGQLAACNRVHDLEQRLARWLLMSSDRVHSDSVALTQEFLAEMLGTARPSVTLAAGALQKNGSIEYVRGVIKIVNRETLEKSACQCYSVIRRYNPILGLAG